MEPIKRGIAAHLPIDYAEIPQPDGNAVLFEMIARGATHDVAIDYDNGVALNDDVGDSDLYFKMQYLRDGYRMPHVVPGGYVTKRPELYRYARRLRRLQERTAPRSDVVGRFSMNRAEDIRGRALAVLHEQDRFEFRGGDVPVSWGEYIDEVCGAKVCLDLPGNGEFCYRLVEYLAVGACVIGPELATEFPVPLRSGVHLIRVPRTLQGLVERCERLVGDSDLRARIRRGAADYFDRNLAPEQLGAYYVQCLWRRADPESDEMPRRRVMQPS
jgi:hypothetical protein